MKKRIKIILIIFCLILCIGIYIPQICMADDWNFDPNDYNSGGASNAATNAAQSIMGTGITVIRTVAIGVAIIMLTYLGIKYMMASPEDKASFKKSAEIYILGAVLLFGTSGILTLIQRFAQDNLSK